VAISNFDSEIVREAIDREESEVMRRELVFDSRVAQTDDQFHADSLSASGL